MKASYFLRKYGTSQFEKLESPFVNSKFICVHSNPIYSAPQVFCRTHRRMEYVEVFENSVKTECGKIIDGIPVEFPLKPTEMLEKIKSHQKRISENRKSLCGRKRIPSLTLYTHLSETISIDNCRKENANYFDDKGSLKEIFGFSLFTNENKNILTLTFFKLDRKNMELPIYYGKVEPIYKPYEIRIDMNGKFSFPSEELAPKPHDYWELKNFPKKNKDLEFLVDFPEEALTQIHDFLNSFVGKPISLNSILKGENLLKGIARYPYEPNFLIFDEKDNYKLNLTPNEMQSADIYNIACEKLKIKSYPTLRKLFYKDPFVLIIYQKITEIGFTDLNIINDVLLDEKRDVLLNFNIHYLSFYGKFLLSNKSERSVWHCLRRLNISSHEDEDFLRMFSETFRFMTDETKESILNDGSTRYNHDLLSKLSNDIKYRNIEIEYKKEQLSLEDEIAGYKFLLPKDTDMLRTLGSRLHNCVASYRYNVLSNICTIVFAQKGEEYRLCIEVRDNFVWQERADRNTCPIGEDKTVVDEWKKKHNLISHGV